MIPSRQHSQLRAVSLLVLVVLVILIGVSVPVPSPAQWTFNPFTNRLDRYGLIGPTGPTGATGGTGPTGPMGATGTVASPPSATTVDLYIATNGSDSNACTSGSKCLTLAHAMTLVPFVLDRPYTIHVADGTYAEGINTQGYNGTYQGRIYIIGNTGTPANVVFSGAVNCNFPLTTLSAGACIFTTVTLNGITVSGGTDRGVMVFGGGNLEANILNVTSSGVLFGVECSFYSSCEFDGAVNISGFTATAGHGLDMNLGGIASLSSGTLTITGATGNNTQVGISARERSLFTIHSPGTLVISGVQTGVYGNGNSNYNATAPATPGVSITNSATPTGSTGVYMEGGALWSFNPAALTVDHFTTCLFADGQGSIFQKSATLTNCGTASNPTANSGINTKGALIVTF